MVFKHVRSKVRYEVKPKPSYTVAAIYDKDALQFKFGISKCSIKDQFNKRIGRVISNGRANARPIIVNVTPEEIEGNKIGTFFVKKALELIK